MLVYVLHIWFFFISLILSGRLRFHELFIFQMDFFVRGLRLSLGDSTTKHLHFVSNWKCTFQNKILNETKIKYIKKCCWEIIFFVYFQVNFQVYLLLWTPWERCFVFCVLWFVQKSYKHLAWMKSLHWESTWNCMNANNWTKTERMGSEKEGGKWGRSYNIRTNPTTHTIV